MVNKTLSGKKVFYFGAKKKCSKIKNHARIGKLCVILGGLK